MKYLIGLIVVLSLGAASAQRFPLAVGGDGVGGIEVALVFHPVFVGQELFAVGEWQGNSDETGTLPFTVVLTPWGQCTISFADFKLAEGDPAILDLLPGGESDATVGTNWCWSAPGPVSGPFHMHVDGSGASLGQAVADLHEAIEALEDAGYTPLPSSACEPEKGTLGPHMHP